MSSVPDVSSFAASEGSALVVASDGLWDAFSDDDAGEKLLQQLLVARREGHVGAPSG